MCCNTFSLNTTKTHTQRTGKTEIASKRLIFILGVRFNASCARTHFIRRTTTMTTTHLKVWLSWLKTYDRIHPMPMHETRNSRICLCSATIIPVLKYGWCIVRMCRSVSFFYQTQPDPGAYKRQTQISNTLRVENWKKQTSNISTAKKSTSKPNLDCEIVKQRKFSRGQGCYC